MHIPTKPHNPVPVCTASAVRLLLLLGALGWASCSPKEPTAADRRAAYHQQLVDQLATERQTVRVTDSLISVLIPQINTATERGFEYEKTEYDDLGRFRPKGMDPGQNVQRTYLRCAVDDYGRTQLIATWCGSRQFSLQQLRIESSDGTSISTSVVPPNDGSNYSYDIDGTHYQSVTFVYAGRITEGMTQDSTMLAHADTDGGALAFIAQHADDAKLTCSLIPAQGREQRLSIGPKDRQAMAATYELGLLLRESIRLTQENKTSSLKVQFLESKLAPTP